jgi:hypothetical protein
MSAPVDSRMDRLTELLADEAAFGLERGEQAELEALMDEGTGLKRDEFMTVASLVQVGLLGRDRFGHQRMPEQLRRKLIEQGQSMVANNRPASNDASVDVGVQRENVSALRPRSAGGSSSSGNRLMPAAGWLLAAMFALAFVVLRIDSTQPDVAPAATASATVLRAELMAEADTIVAPWATPTEAGFEQVTGDVVWNNRRQQGYLRLAGMPSNDAQQMQYQLWIVDPDRDKNPVDGGVFNIPVGQREILIPIDAKLAVLDPKAFAITAEQPGGVVVSAGPLLVVAPATTEPRPNLG